MAETIVDETDIDAVDLIVGQRGLGGLPPGGRIMAFRDKDGIRGGWLFERYTGVNGSIHAHWAGRDMRWLKHYMLTLAAMYIFDQLKCKIVYGEVRGKATGTQLIDQKLGFVEVARLEKYYPDDDLIIYELRKENCTWLPDDFKETEEDGRERRSATGAEVGQSPNAH